VVSFQLNFKYEFPIPLIRATPVVCKTMFKLYEILGSQGGEDVGVGLLSSNAV
jgi:hypothetical protein